MEIDAALSPPHASRQMRLLLDASRALAVPSDLDSLLCRIATIACELLGCERASIFLHDASTGELLSRVALGSGEIRLPSRAGIVGHAFTTNQVVCVHDPYADDRFYAHADQQSGFVTRNLLSAPMKGLDGRPVGAIECVNKIDKPFDDVDLALIELLADQAGVAVQRHQLQVQAVRAAVLRREMELARKAQEALIPSASPPIVGLEAVGWTLPASTTGGDCFDLWKLADGRLGVLLADASGHGLAPAMLVGQVRTLIRALAGIYSDPHVILDHVNKRLLEDLSRGHFVTAFLGFVSSEGLLDWSSAGQGPIFLRPRREAACMCIDPPFPPLGIERWEAGSPPASISIEPGGACVLVSDGATEALNRADELFGIDRTIQSLNEWRGVVPGELLARLRDTVNRWQSGREPLDDQTIVVVART